jgi:hypothetical protein
MLEISPEVAAAQDVIPKRSEESGREDGAQCTNFSPRAARSPDPSLRFAMTPVVFLQPLSEKNSNT